MIQKRSKTISIILEFLKIQESQKIQKFEKIDLAQCHVKRYVNSFDVPKFNSSAFLSEILIFQKFEKISSFGHFVY